ncbi:ABC transporter permease [Xanthocytophaga flava]|uniref:ABC transporter permease n=1 Tax=Xanthocytophaga flava TaxID=3048013 RepID=UPI0028D22CBD|nr:ABC transporter permease [Xanthocytophaga flavus]MDJ1466587.1 ABC transporter permease [Xanthocytophaga flavus]
MSKEDHIPPRWLDWLLERFCAPHLWEEVQGDLHERYQLRIKRTSKQKADWLYFRDTISYLRLSIFKRKDSLKPILTDMLRNYLTIALRNLTRNKTYSVINIGGLAVGMVVAMLIGLWIYDELSYDNYHSNYEHIAQVMDTRTFNGESTTSDLGAIPLATELRTKYANHFEHVSLVWKNYTHVLAVGDKKVAQSGVWTQPEFPEMLGLHMLKGSRGALKDPSSVLITNSLSKALFGEKDPLGQIIRIDNMAEVKVAGVFEDLPKNSTFYETKLFLAWDKAVSTFGGGVKEAQADWDYRNWRIFVQLKEGTDIHTVNDIVKHIAQPHIKEGKEEILLYPMRQWHLYNQFENGQVAGGRIQFVWMFGIIGVFVLLLACINFMNLSTARSEKRAKEVGIRKAIGSVRTQLIGQFLSESILISFLALVLALAFLWISLPFFNQIAHKEIHITWASISFWTIILGFTLLTGLLAGSYPAIYLSSFETIKVLKGTLQIGRLATLPRKVLVVTQFTVSVTLIIGTIIVYQQIQFAKNRPVGYNREGLILIHMNTPELYDTPYNFLRSQLLQTGAVKDMARSSDPTTDISYIEKNISWKGKDPNLVPLLGSFAVTHDYGNTLGWQIKEGRDFSREFPTDTGSVIINEAAAKLMGLKHPVGEHISAPGQPDRIITGVVKDMIVTSPYQATMPMLYMLEYKWSNFIMVRLSPSLSAHEALERMEPVFKKINPGSEFDYTFVDEEYAHKFSDEERIANLATLFTTLSIFLSCLGLFGLATFMAEQRIKEIGIRKVLGASVFSLWQLLSKDFVILVSVAFLIAVPISWYFSNSWLQQYEYRTSIAWWVFIASGAGALLITLLTISFQTLKAASRNPIKSLRTE